MAKIADILKEVPQEVSVRYEASLKRQGILMKKTDRIVEYECWNCGVRYLTPYSYLDTNIGKMCNRCAFEDEN